MNESLDHGVRELGNTVLALRDELVFLPRTDGDDQYYIVEDPLNSKFYRLGVDEYAFVSFLDGNNTINGALSLMSTARPDHKLNEHDAATVCKWLVESGLAHTTDTGEADHLSSVASQTEQQKTLGRLNPLVYKLTLGNPNQIFNVITPWLGWLYSPIAFVAWILIATAGAFQVYDNWDRFVAASRGVFAPSNWLWLAGCWIVLKLFHEASHGIVCKRYGGAVRETGAIFILFAPLAYVDVTSSWRFSSRCQRIYTAAAGMYVELLIAAIAATVWCKTSNEYLNYLCFNIIVMSSLTTILFNANPLMRFDGYYILSDLLGISNLYVNGQQYVRYCARRFFLGLPGTLPAWSLAKGLFIRVYGIAALLWRLFISVSLTIAAATIFHGAGIVLAALALVAWFGIPTFRFFKYLVTGHIGEQPNRLRFFWTAGILSTTVVLLLTIVPWPGTVQAPAVVQFTPKTVVRAISPGFVSEVFIHDGQTVKQCAKLLVLRNELLEQELADLKLAIKQSEIKSRMLKQKGEFAACQAEVKNREALIQRLNEKDLENSHLTIHAATDGTIIGRNIESLIGTYVERGKEIATIGCSHQKELRASINQDDLDAFALRVGKTINVHLPGETKFKCLLTTVDPRASINPTHHAFCGVYDGPLPVRRSENESRGDNVTNKYEFLSPRFSSIIALDQAQSQHCRAGQLGKIECRPFDQSIGTHLVHLCKRWIRNKLQYYVKH